MAYGPYHLARARGAHMDFCPLCCDVFLRVQAGHGLPSQFWRYSQFSTGLFFGFFFKPQTSVLPFLANHLVEKHYGIWAAFSWKCPGVVTMCLQRSCCPVSSLRSAIQSLVQLFVLTSPLLDPRRGRLYSSPSFLLLVHWHRSTVSRDLWHFFSFLSSEFVWRILRVHGNVFFFPWRDCPHTFLRLTPRAP